MHVYLSTLVTVLFTFCRADGYYVLAQSQALLYIFMYKGRFMWSLPPGSSESLFPFWKQNFIINDSQ